MKQVKENILFALLRICLGFIFLWAFVDKLFGLGFATEPAKSWLAGGSPTTGFLKFAAKGPLAELYQSLAGVMWIDWLFMIGLLLIGVCLVLGIALRIAGRAGALLVLLMWSAVLPPSTNPIVDDHIIYFFVLLILPMMNAGHTLGFGKQWSKSEIVKALPILT